MSLDVFKGAVTPVFGTGALSNTVSGFMAGVFGTMLNCWCDVCRTGIQKKAIGDTFNKDIPRPEINPKYFTEGVTDFFGTASSIMASKGIQGLYAGFLVKSFYLGGSGALLAMLIPKFKQFYGVA